jgi:hypothetical protein
MPFTQPLSVRIFRRIAVSSFQSSEQHPEEIVSGGALFDLSLKYLKLSNSIEKRSQCEFFSGRTWN